MEFKKMISWHMRDIRAFNGTQNACCSTKNKEKSSIDVCMSLVGPTF